MKTFLRPFFLSAAFALVACGGGKTPETSNTVKPNGEVVPTNEAGGEVGVPDQQANVSDEAKGSYQRGWAAWVTGDGRSSVRELIDLQINCDPRRGITEDFPLNRITLGEDAVVLLDLQRQGVTPTAVPAAGQRVLIQRNGNVAIDCTAQVHPEVAHAVSLAARTIGLDIAGVDLVSTDIGKPLSETGGAIVEVNAGPGLLMHLKPAAGSPQPVGQAIIDHLFAEDETGRIPVVGVAGSRGTHTISRLVAWLLHLNGRHVGLACRDGLFLDKRQVEKYDCATASAARRAGELAHSGGLGGGTSTTDSPARAATATGWPRPLLFSTAHMFRQPAGPLEFTDRSEPGDGPDHGVGVGSLLGVVVLVELLTSVR